MSDHSPIEWTDATWNPWHGCHKVSPGCKLCYMFREKKQYGQDPNIVVRSKTTFNAPLRWKDPQLVFTCSWSDWLIEEADAWREEAYGIIRRTPHLTYQILTKRIERAAGRVPDPPLPNLWLGVSVEDQQRADERIPVLLQTPAAVRFLSVEPLLGPVDLTTIPNTYSLGEGQRWYHALKGYAWESDGADYYDVCNCEPKLDWVIVGGESGPGARPMHPDWVRSIRDQCVTAGVPFFFKQWGENLPPMQDGNPARIPQIINSGDDPIRVGKKAAGRLLDGREWSEIPRSLDPQTHAASVEQKVGDGL